MALPADAQVHIERGTRDQKKLVFPEQSHIEEGRETGDCVVIVDVQAHPVFQRSGLDLLAKMVPVIPYQPLSMGGQTQLQ